MKFIVDNTEQAPSIKFVVDHISAQLLATEKSIPSPTNKMALTSFVAENEPLVKEVNPRLFASRSFRNNFAFMDADTHNMFMSVKGLEFCGDELNRFAKMVRLSDIVFGKDTDRAATIIGVDNRMMDVLLAKGIPFEAWDETTTSRDTNRVKLVDDYWKKKWSIPSNRANTTVFFLKVLPEKTPKESLYVANLELYDWISFESLKLKPSSFCMVFDFPHDTTLPSWLERIGTKYHVSFFRCGREHNSECFLFATSIKPPMAIDVLKGTWKAFLTTTAYRIMKYNSIRDAMVSGGLYGAFRVGSAQDKDTLKRACRYWNDSVSRHGVVSAPVPAVVDFEIDVSAMDLQERSGGALPIPPPPGQVEEVESEQEELVAAKKSKKSDGKSEVSAKVAEKSSTQRKRRS
jgi:hypothetical protein